jgi:hypothetical protein
MQPPFFSLGQLCIRKLHLGQDQQRLLQLQPQPDPRPCALNRAALRYAAFPTNIAHSSFLLRISGPVAGDPFPPSADTPPAVVPEFFNQVCPNRTVIDSREVNNALSDASAATLLQAWVDKLEQTEDRCIEIEEHSGQIFDLWCVISCYPFS